MTNRYNWLFLVLFISFGFFQENETCEECHDDSELTTTKYGMIFSLDVISNHLVDTPHEGFDCIDCHTDLEGMDEDEGHAERLILPDCGECHTDALEDFINGFHKPLRDKGYTAIPTCSDCHGTHKVTWRGEPRQACGTCHQDVLDDFFHSAHWDSNDNTSELTCTSCHSGHNKFERYDYTDSEWKIHLAESCADCHEENVENYFLSAHYQQVKSGNLSAPICSDCHSKHKVLSPRDLGSRVSIAKLDVVCSECHDGYNQSIHRPKENSNPQLETCVVCHTGHETEMLGDSPTSVFGIKLDRVCITCHTETLLVGESDAHGGIHRDEILKVEQGESSNCGDCHTYHYNAPNHDSDLALEKSCADCHEKEQRDYLNSSHYIARQKGHLEAPTCYTCHNSERIQKSDEQFLGQSTVELCSNCHGDREKMLQFQLDPNVVQGYETSYHGQMYQLGHQGEEFATCVSCHDNHSILPSNDVRSSIHKTKIVETCARCHKDANENFAEFLQHYTPHASIDVIMPFVEGSTFGVVKEWLISKGDHVEPSDILCIVSIGEMDSTITADFAGTILGIVPPDSNGNYNSKSVLLQINRDEHSFLDLIHTFMVWLLVGTLSVFGGHTLFWLIRLLVKRVKDGPIHKPTISKKRVARFNVLERVLHFFMAGGFLTLAATGLPLKYSHSIMATWVANNVLGFGQAASTHRIAATILGIVFAVHIGKVVYKMVVKRQAKKMLWSSDSLVPNLQDAKDFIAHIAYFIGLRKSEPKFGRWTYWEKFDYIAVFWGMFVIGASGVMLWFPEEFSLFWPGWLINIAHIVHSEEALLATAFIFTVHFFNTHFRPGAFPMDEVIFTGYMTEEKFKEERPLEIEQLNSDQYKQKLVDPATKFQRFWLRLIGFIFMAIGLFLLVLIVIGTLTTTH